MLGAILVGTRVIGLGHSYWHDEIVTIRDFVRVGPSDILAGPGINHELFSLLIWATSSMTGESEIVLRLWSALPFIAGVVVVTAWLHLRFGSMAGIVFLYLATASPLLLDITRQARGYGLAFLAMAVLIVAALEATRTARTRAVVVFCIAGVLGAWTLPQLGIAFFATGIALLGERSLRRPVALGLGLSLLAVGAWYAPHVSEVHTASQVEDGVQIQATWILTAPIDQVLVPALIWIDGTALIAGYLWLPVVLLTAVIMASSPLARDRRTLLVLASGVVATTVALWAARAYVVPRYVSFLLVPLFVLLATGMSAVFARLSTRPAVVRTVGSLVVLGLLAGRFASIAPDVLRLPREANADAAGVIERHGGATLPVLAYLHNPRDLAFYLGRPVRALDPSDLAAQVCARRETVAFVTQPFVVRPVEVPCLRRPGVAHYRFRQYTRGREMNVWLVPPSG